MLLCSIIQEYSNNKLNDLEMKSELSKGQENNKSTQEINHEQQPEY